MARHSELRLSPVPDSVFWSDLPFINEGRYCMLSPRAAQICFWRVAEWRLKGAAGSIVYEHGEKQLVSDAFDLKFPSGYWSAPPADEVALFTYDWSNGTQWNDADARMSFTKVGSAWGGEEGETHELVPSFAFGDAWNWDKSDRGPTHWSKPELVTHLDFLFPWEQIGIDTPLGTTYATYFELAAPDRPFYATLTSDSSGFGAGYVKLTMDARLEPYRVWPWARSDGSEPRWDEFTGSRLSPEGAIETPPLIEVD